MLIERSCCYSSSSDRHSCLGPSGWFLDGQWTRLDTFGHYTGVASDPDWACAQVPPKAWQPSHRQSMPSIEGSKGVICPLIVIFFGCVAATEPTSAYLGHRIGEKHLHEHMSLSKSSFGPFAQID